MKWDDLDCTAKNVIKLGIMAIVIAVLFCMCVTLSSCKSCSSAANAYAAQNKDAIMALEYKNQLYSDMLRAYNNLLHRIWLDNPTYVEEVLTESDEFCTLDGMIGGNWEDTFQFYNEEDSLSYYMNWDKAVKIPEPTKSRLKQVFGDDYE